MGSGPIVSYHYGAANLPGLQACSARACQVIISVSSLVMVTASELLSRPLSIALWATARSFLE